MSEFDDDLTQVLDDLADQGLGEDVSWAAGGSGTPVPVTVMADELPDSVAMELAGSSEVRMCDVTVPMAIIPDPKRDDVVSFTDSESPFYGTWTALGIERRTRTHRVIRLRFGIRRRTGDAGARETKR